MPYLVTNELKIIYDRIMWLPKDTRLLVIPVIDVLGNNEYSIKGRVIISSLNMLGYKANIEMSGNDYVFKITW